MMRTSLGRLRMIERQLPAILGRGAWFCARRAPVLAVTLTYVLLLMMAPPQVVDVLRTVWSEGSWLAWLAIVTPPLLAGVGHLALQSAVTPIVRTGDTAIASSPLAVLTAMVGAWVPKALLFMLPCLLAGTILYYHLVPTISRNSKRWCRTAIAAVVAVFVASVTAIQSFPLALPTAIGPLAVLTLGLATIGLLLAIAALRPILSILYLLCCVIAALFWNGSAPVRLFDEDLYVSGHSLSDGLYQWVRSRGDLQDYKIARRPYPVIIASAEGGGIYAAAHAYLGLSAMSEVCPNFTQHLFATVGVSGGSVGTLLYSAKVDPLAAARRLQPCHDRTGEVDVGPLTTDLLSPALANLLFLQTANFLIPGPSVFRDGGQTLTNAVATMDPGNGRLVEPLRASWNPRGARPATIFVATDVNNGNRFVFTPLDNGGAETAETFPSGNIVSLSDIGAHTAAVISARFPWLTSTARLRVSENSYRILADGGYFENSGAETAMDLVRQIRTLGLKTTSCIEGEKLNIDGSDACKCPLVIATRFSEPVTWSDCNLNIFIAYMPMAGSVEGSLGYAYEDTPDPSQSYVLDPLSTMLRTRTTRGQLAIEHARSFLAKPDDPTFAQGLNADFGYFPHQLPIEDLGLPLGWKLSRKAALDILALAAPTGACLQLEEEENSASEQSDPTTPSRSAEMARLPPSRIQNIAYANGCSMRMLAWLFNPSRQAGGFGIEAQ